MSGLVVTCLVFFSGLAVAQPSPESLESCRELAVSEQRINCVARVELPPLPAPGSAAAEPDRSATQGPGWTQALLDRMDAAARVEDWKSAARAAWLLVGSNGGIGGLQWVGVNGDPVWTAPIDGGSERLSRMARSLHLAERDDLAEPLLRRALALGESGDGWDAATIERLTPATEALTSETWHLPLDSLTLSVIDAEPVVTDDLRGDVVVFDFWAGWCEPCREELPLMEAFHDENSERGLHTFAVNVDEPRATARATAQALGLGLPVVVYTAELKEAFEVTQLPTVVLVDRAGRIRGRWEVFKDGTKERIFWAIEEMLNVQDGEAEIIAERLSGDRVLGVRWMREFRGVTEGVAAVASPGGESRVIVTHGRTLLILQPDGRTERKFSGNLIAGRLVPSRPDADGGYALLSYRVGATSVSQFEFPAGSAATWEAPAPVFDVQWVDPRDPRSGAVLGTLDGIAEVDDEGRPVRSADIGLVRGLVRHPASTADDTGPAWLALTGRAEPRGWQTLAADLTPLASREVSLAPWRVQGAVAGGRFGLLPSSVKAVAVGRFFAGVEQDQLAVAGAGQLVILATDSGAELYRARWDGIGDLAAADLDGDGLDELLVAWGHRLALLSEFSSGVTHKKSEMGNLN